MKTVRLAVTWVGVVLLGGGYFASQAAYWNGTASQYANAVAQSAVPNLATVVLLATIVLCVIPDKEAEN